MPTDGITLANQLFMRVDQKLTPSQCIPFLNHALAKIGATSSWIWDQVSAVGSTPVANILVVPTMHQGKKVSAFNSANLLPIVRIEQCDMGSSAAGFLNVNGTIYSTFRMGSNLGVPFLEFFPALLVNPSVDVYFHQLPPTLTISNPLVTVRWMVPEMDDLLLDIAEQEVRRLYKMPVDKGFVEENMSRLQMASVAFSVERTNTGPIAEVEAAAMDKAGGRE